MCSVLDSGELQSLLATKVVLVCWIYTFYYDIFRGCFPAKLLKVLPKQHRLDGRTVKDWPPNTTNFLLPNKSWPDVVVVSLMSTTLFQVQPTNQLLVPPDPSILDLAFPIVVIVLLETTKAIYNSPK